MIFVICLGYKQYVVKEFFADYFLHTSDVTFDLANNKMEVHNNYAEPWKVTLVDTGFKYHDRRPRKTHSSPYIGDGAVYADLWRRRGNDGLKGTGWTSTSLMERPLPLPPSASISRRVYLDIGPDNTIRSFREKAASDGAIINGGFMVLNPEVFST